MRKLKGMFIILVLYILWKLVKNCVLYYSLMFILFEKGFPGIIQKQPATIMTNSWESTGSGIFNKLAIFSLF